MAFRGYRSSLFVLHTVQLAATTSKFLQIVVSILVEWITWSLNFIVHHQTLRALAKGGKHASCLVFRVKEVLVPPPCTSSLLNGSKHSSYLSSKRCFRASRPIAAIDVDFSHRTIHVGQLIYHTSGYIVAELERYIELSFY